MRPVGTAIYVLGVVLWIAYGGILLAVAAAVARTGLASITVWHVVILAALALVPYGVLRIGKRLRSPPSPA